MVEEHCCVGVEGACFIVDKIGVFAFADIKMTLSAEDDTHSVSSPFVRQASLRHGEQSD